MGTFKLEPLVMTEIFFLYQMMALVEMQVIYKLMEVQVQLIFDTMVIQNLQQHLLVLMLQELY